jgi:hypothetical protein
VALDPPPIDVVRFARCIEALPQLGVLHGLLVGRFPAVAFPAVDPGRDAVLDVIGVSVKFDLAGPLQGLQGRDGRHQFHAVVGGIGLTAAEFLAVPAPHEDGTPAAGAGISRAGAVGIDDDGVSLGHWMSWFFRAGGCRADQKP